LIERLRRQREQRERASTPRRESGRSSRSVDAVERRFAAGDSVFCPPYGYGTVRSSQIQGGGEVLMVAFEDFGELTIDPSRSLVRKVEQQAESEDDVL
jgi:hypothetical protein